MNCMSLGYFLEETRMCYLGCWWSSIFLQSPLSLECTIYCRHEDGAHWQEHTVAHRVQGHLCRRQPQRLQRPRIGACKNSDVLRQPPSVVSVLRAGPILLCTLCSLFLPRALWRAAVF